MRIVKAQCPNIHCGYLNVFPEDELVGEVPMVDNKGNRIPPPPVEIDDNTVFKCEACGYPIFASSATIDEVK